MVESLVHTHPLRGMTRAAVLELLGPPDWTAAPDSRPPALNREAGEFEYHLGLWPGLTFDEGLLKLVFDEKGQVKRWNIWRSPED